MQQCNDNVNNALKYISTCLLQMNLASAFQLVALTHCNPHYLGQQFQYRNMRSKRHIRSLLSKYLNHFIVCHVVSRFSLTWQCNLASIKDVRLSNFSVSISSCVHMGKWKKEFYCSFERVQLFLCYLSEIFGLMIFFLLRQKKFQYSFTTVLRVRY